VALQALYLYSLLHKNYKLCTQSTSGCLSQNIATFVTFMWYSGVEGGLRAKVLGRMGNSIFSHRRACALSCPSPAIYGPGFSHYPTRPAYSDRLIQPLGAFFLLC
jgi:hypothetical protein